MGRRIEGSKVGNKAVALGSKFLDWEQSNNFLGNTKLGTTHTFFLLNIYQKFHNELLGRRIIRSIAMHTRTCVIFLHTHKNITCACTQDNRVVIFAPAHKNIMRIVVFSHAHTSIMCTAIFLPFSYHKKL